MQTTRARAGRVRASAGIPLNCWLSTTFKCTGAATEAAKTATTSDTTAVLQGDFYRAGDDDDESFTAQMIVSATDIAPDIPGLQNLRHSDRPLQHAIIRSARAVSREHPPASCRSASAPPHWAGASTIPSRIPPKAWRGQDAGDARRHAPLSLPPRRRGTIR